jgi:PPE-repeat protein
MAPPMTAAGYPIEQPRMRARLQVPVSPLAVPANRLGRASGGSIFEKSKPAGGGWAAAAALLPDGRLHLQHGPIDILAEAFGAPDAVADAYRRAAQRFATVLEGLVAELPALRSEDQPLQGEIALAMVAAVAPFRPAFITPMAAVAGAVADAVVATSRYGSRPGRS